MVKNTNTILSQIFTPVRPSKDGTVVLCVSNGLGDIDAPFQKMWLKTPALKAGNGEEYLTKDLLIEVGEVKPNA